MCATARDIKVRDILIDIQRPKLNMAAYKMKSATKTSIYNCYLLCTGTNLKMFVFPSWVTDNLCGSKHAVKMTMQDRIWELCLQLIIIDTAEKFKGRVT